MTILELFILVAWAGIALVGGVLGAHVGGPVGATLGAALATILPLAVGKVGRAVWRKTSQNRPLLPPCVRGRCDAPRYGFVKIGDDWAEECACGDRYRLSRSLGRVRFLRVLENGASVPYMVHRPWGPWRPDPDPDPGVRTVYRG